MTVEHTKITSELQSEEYVETPLTQCLFLKLTTNCESKALERCYDIKLIQKKSISMLWTGWQNPLVYLDGTAPPPNFLIYNTMLNHKTTYSLHVTVTVHCIKESKAENKVEATKDGTK